MARLYRPSIPLEVKCRVLLRQLGELWPDAVIEEWKRKHTSLLVILQGRLAKLRTCEIKDLRLDHDPPLALRPQTWNRQGKFDRYVPDANDPEYLLYRPHGAQFEGSHDVKTRIRGEHGQFSDIALIKRQRRRERPPKPKKPFASKGFAKKSSNLAKQKIPSRPFSRRKK
jgi:hypothetical protein